MTALLGFIINVASAQDFSADLKYVSDYFYRGIAKSEEAIQSSIALNTEAAGLNISAGAFTSQSVNAGADSYQFTIGASKSFADDLVSFYGGLNHFEDVDGEAIFEFGLSTSLNVLLNPTLNIFRSFEDELFTWELGANHKFDLGFSNLCLHASYGESEITEALEVDYYNVGALASKSISDNADLLLGADFIDTDSIDQEWVFSTGISINF